MTGAARDSGSGPLALLFLTFPAVFLPLDMIYAGPWIMAYATWGQAARIFLYCAGLALAMSALACLIVASIPALVRHARAVCLALIALALLHGMLLWSQYFAYSDDYQWLRQVGVVVLSAAAGPFLARRLGEQHISALGAVLRASAVVAAIVAVGAALVAARSAPDDRPAPGAQQAGNRPSIFLITIDTLSALYLPMYGYDRPTAPRLAEFAGGASVFLRNYANSNFTTPAMNSIMQGTRPWTHRAVQLEARPLDESAASLPALLKAAGYFTAAVSTNAWAGPRHLGLERHFSALSENNLCPAADPALVLPPELQVAIKSSLAWRAVHSFIVWASDRIGLCAGRHFDPELAFAEARRLLARAPGGQPLFLWVHLFPPHDPYITPAPFAGAFAPSLQARDRASTIPPYLFEAGERLDFPGLWLLRYLEAIRYLDHHVGAFLDELKKKGLFAPSLIVITADHGESFSRFYGHHGGPGLHEELVRVPLLLKAPGQTERKEVRQLSEQVDLMPTILELAAIAPRPRLEGVSLAPALRGQAIERPVFSMNFQQATRLGPLDAGSVAMLEGRWKYVHYLGKFHYPRMPPLEDALYDLAADPRETSSQIALQPRLAARMRKEIDARLREHGGRIR